MSTLGVILCRLDSVRLPRKQLLPIFDTTVIGLQARRIGGLTAKTCDSWAILSTTRRVDDALRSASSAIGFKLWRYPNVDDLLGRILSYASSAGGTRVLVATGDDPFIDPRVVQFLLNAHIASRALVSTNYYSRSFPNGQIISVYEVDALIRTRSEFPIQRDDQHLIDLAMQACPPGRVLVQKAPKEWTGSDISFALDTRQDYEKLLALAKVTTWNVALSYLIRLVKTKPELARRFQRTPGVATY